MRGIGFSEMRRNPYLVPIFMCCVASPIFGLYSACRALTQHPEVYLTRKTIGPETYRRSRYKFWSTPINKKLSEDGSKAPIYDKCHGS